MLLTPCFSHLISQHIATLLDEAEDPLPQRLRARQRRLAQQLQEDAEEAQRLQRVGSAQEAGPGPSSSAGAAAKGRASGKATGAASAAGASTSGSAAGAVAITGQGQEQAQGQGQQQGMQRPAKPQEPGSQPREQCGEYLWLWGRWVHEQVSYSFPVRRLVFGALYLVSW